MIKIENVSFSYVKSVPVLNNINFDIKEGECVILLGPNGVGKSTLISLILGSNKLQKGNVYFDDIPLKEMTPRLKAEHISYVPQLINGNDLTVYDTILLGRLPQNALICLDIEKCYKDALLEIGIKTKEIYEE